MSKFQERGISYLEEVVKNSSSFAEILRKYDYSASSAAYRTLKRCLNGHGISYKHIIEGTNSNARRVADFSIKPLETYLVVNSSVTNGQLKKRLFSEGVKEELCENCGLGPEWNGEYLSLHLDHINGDNRDNRIENLRILCPNCHTQTGNYAGKSSKNTCLDCGARVSRGSNRCKECFQANHYREEDPVNKVFRLNRKELSELVWAKPTTEIAKEYGISDTAVAKRCKRLGVAKPPRGYWAKKKHGVL